MYAIRSYYATNKQDVGKRLAAVVLHNTYNQKAVVFSGPTFRITSYNVCYTKLLRNTIEVYTSANGTNLRLSKSNNQFTVKEVKQPLETQTCVFVNPNKEFQTFLGIGGAITDASAEVFAKLSQEKQQEFLNAYFSEKDGIGYSVLRTNMNSCDFSSASYTYVQDGDKDLNSFDISVDKRFKIPMLKKAMNLIGSKASFYISPWSPPAFMKDSNNMLRGGKLLPQYYQSWANYYVNRITSYNVCYTKLLRLVLISIKRAIILMLQQTSLLSIEKVK